VHGRRMLGVEHAGEVGRPETRAVSQSGS
jgi:hypothetical protein